MTDHYLDGFSEIAREVHGDARELLNRIDAKDERASRFKKERRITLEQFLETSGHYDPRPRLEREQAWAHVLMSEFSEARPEMPALRARFEWLWESLERADRERRA